MNRQPRRYKHDQAVWDRCAGTYERQIVNGHPDVTAYESFEHSFIERLVITLTRDCGRNMFCYDFGCGSGRIHLLLAPQLFPTVSPDGTEREKARPAGRLVHVGGIDFSEQMIALARDNLAEADLRELSPDYLSFDTGSAFDVPAYSGDATPLAVSVCNSIGVMQGPEGARRLFSAMRRYVKSREGIALISCYRREAVAGFALSNYESTMDVCGQPCWLKPRTFASSEYRMVPHYYKRAHDRDPHMVVDVFDSANRCVRRNFTLTRDNNAVDEVIATGKIDTFSGYHSRWYAAGRIQSWMREFWGDGTLWHIPGSKLDCLRGEPAQLALVDYSGSFEPLARSWGLMPLNG